MPDISPQRGELSQDHVLDRRTPNRDAGRGQTILGSDGRGLLAGCEGLLGRSCEGVVSSFALFDTPGSSDLSFICFQRETSLIARSTAALKPSQLVFLASRNSQLFGSPETR